MKTTTYIIVCLLSLSIAFGQCGCPGNGTEINMSSIEEMSKSFTRNNFLFFNLFYKYSFADDYFRKDSRQSEGPIKSLSANFADFKIGYKPINEILLETDLGYLINKTQENRSPNQKIKSSGLSDLTFSARYIFLKDNVDNIELSFGSGIKIPVVELHEWIPQNIQPSTGAYAWIINFYAKKYFPSISSGLVLGHRTDFNFKDKWNYRYGNSHITTLIFLYSPFDFINTGLELRNDIRLKDRNNDLLLNESGMFNIQVSPILRFLYQGFILTANFEYPFYHYFNGFQIANRYSIALNLSYIL